MSSTSIYRDRPFGHGQWLDCICVSCSKKFVKFDPNYGSTLCPRCLEGKTTLEGKVKMDESPALQINQLTIELSQIKEILRDIANKINK